MYGGCNGRLRYPPHPGNITGSMGSSDRQTVEIKASARQQEMNASARERERESFIRNNAPPSRVHTPRSPPHLSGTSLEARASTPVDSVTGNAEKLHHVWHMQDLGADVRETQVN